MIGATAGATAQTPAATTAYAPVVHVAKPKKRRI
jgi:hypothetical protein